MNPINRKPAAEVAFGNAGLRNTLDSMRNNSKNYERSKGTETAKLIRKILFSKFGKLPLTEWVVVRCFHHRDIFGNSLRINTLTGKFCCLGCGIRGSGIAELIGISRNYSNSKAQSIVMGEAKYA